MAKQQTASGTGVTTDALRAADGSTSQRADRRLNRRPAGSGELNTFPSLGFLNRITLELPHQKENSLLHWLLTLSARAGSAAAESTSPRLRPFPLERQPIKPDLLRR